jgi:predicted RNA methylase
LLAEIIDTGLLDELQVPVINDLRKRKIVTERTKFIPNHYQTFLELVNANDYYYGYRITSPKHEWPFYSDKHNNWLNTNIVPVSEKREVVSTDFTLEAINEEIREKLVFNLEKGEVANAIRLSGIIRLCEGIELGPTNVLNGDKIIAIDPIEGFDQVTLEIMFKMGNGLGNLSIRQIDTR